MERAIFIVTYDIGEYSDRSSHNYAAYTRRDQAEEVALNLEKYCSWHQSHQNDLYLIVKKWRHEYEVNYPKPPRPGVRPSKSPKYDDLSQ